MILAIDPGNVISGYIVCTDDGMPMYGENVENHILEEFIDCFYDISQDEKVDSCVVEMIKSYSIGSQTLFDTAYWAGRFSKAWDTHNPKHKAAGLYRPQVIKTLFGQRVKSADSKVRALMIELYGEPGTKSDPGPTGFITSHMWQALGLANAYARLRRSPDSGIILGSGAGWEP